MKTFQLLLLLAIATSCGSNKIDNTLNSFEDGYHPYAQSWTGGIPGSGSGINLFLPLDSSEMEYMDAVYYKGMVTHSYDSKDLNGYIIARFKTDFNNKPDSNMNMDPKDEYGNQPPLEKIPSFKLQEDEAVVKFIRMGKTSYTKITGIKTTQPDRLPARPQ